MIFRTQWFFFFLRDVSSFFVSDGEMRQFLTQRVLLGGFLMRQVILFVLPDFIFMIQTTINSFLAEKIFLEVCVILLIKIREKSMKWRLINKHYIIIEN